MPQRRQLVRTRSTASLFSAMELDAVERSLTNVINPLQPNKKKAEPLRVRPLELTIHSEFLRQLEVEEPAHDVIN